MSDERKSVLEMLAAGKLTVDEAERLLAVLEEEPEAEPARARANGGGRRERGDEDSDADDGPFGLGGIEEEIQAGLDEARSAIASIGAEVGAEIGAAFRDSGVLGNVWRRGGRRRERFGTKHRREVSESRPVTAGARVSVRNGRGSVRYETWDRPEVEVTGAVVARSRNEEDARQLAESVAVDLLEAEGEVRVETHLPSDAGDPRGAWETDLLIRLPDGSELDTESRHGKTIVPTINADVSVRNAHGSTKIESVSGALQLRHGHGKVEVGSVGGDATIDVRHGKSTFGDVAGAVSLRNQHAPARMGSVGRDLDLFSAHGNVRTGDIGGSVRGRIRHSRLEIDGATGGEIELEASHSRLSAGDVGGDVSFTARHGGLSVGDVGGELSVESNHAPVSIGRVGKDVRIRSSHGRVDVAGIGGNAEVESNRGLIVLREVEGGVEVTDSHSDVRILGSRGSVSVTKQRGVLSVIPDEPITHDCSIEVNRGSVDLVIPDGSDLEVSGVLERSEVLGSVPGIEYARAGRGASLSGRLGDGSASLEIQLSRSQMRLGESPSQGEVSWDHP